MQARRCQGCGASLPEVEPAGPIECPFCGLLHDRDAAGQSHVVKIDLSGGRARPTSRWVFAILGLVCLVVIVSLLPVVFGLVAAWRTVEGGAAPLIDAVTTAVSTSARRTTAELKDLPLGHHPLDVSPPAGGYARVDPLAALPWALTIAQAWESDAQVERIDVERLHPDGTINVQDDVDAQLRYRFVSPSAITRLRQRANVQASAEEVVGFWITVKQGQPTVYADRRPAPAVRGEEAPPYPQGAMALPALFATASVRELAADLPFLKGYLISPEREGWVWYFSSLANESLPRVRATDGAVWPYGR